MKVLKQKMLRVLTVLVLLTFTVSTLTNYIPVVSAQGITAHIRIVGSTKTIWSGDVTADGCTITDKDGGIHTYTQPLAVCVLDTASKLGNFTYVVKDFGGSLGLFLEAITEDKSASDFSTYWLYDVNGKTAEVGISTLVVNNSDSLYFHFVNPATDPNQIAINDGITYLRSQQGANGQINGFSGVTAWAAQAFASAGVDPATVKNGGFSLLDYLSSNPPATSSPATDWERAILAITSSGVNPYNFGGIDYVAKLETYHNNAQIGATTLLNDDIFGLLALISAGSDAPSSTKQDALNFILSHQNIDGGFSWSTTESSDTDDTAAALQALAAAQTTHMSAPNLSNAITNAKNYILSAKNSDGGFPYLKDDLSNTSTSAWVVMALSSLGSDQTIESTNAKSYIRENQEQNGSFKWQPSSGGETFTTSYAILALTGKFWPLFTLSPTVTPSLSPTPTPTSTPTLTPTPTPTPTPTSSITPTPTPTNIPSPTPSPISMPTSTSTPQPTSIPTDTIMPKPKIGRRSQSLEESIETVRKEIRKNIDTLRKEMRKQQEKIRAIWRINLQFFHQTKLG